MSTKNYSEKSAYLKVRGINIELFPKVIKDAYADESVDKAAFAKQIEDYNKEMKDAETAETKAAIDEIQQAQETIAKYSGATKKDDDPFAHLRA